jgi:hypothetical protein
MGRILCKYPNGAIHYYKPRYDGRQKPEKLIKRINAEYKPFPDHVGIIEFCCRGWVYTAIEPLKAA